MPTIHNTNSPTNPTIPRLPSRPAWVLSPPLRRSAAELIHHVPQILLGGATIIGGIFAGTWLYMSAKQARKASREPGEKGALPSC